MQYLVKCNGVVNENKSSERMLTSIHNCVWDMPSTSNLTSPAKKTIVDVLSSTSHVVHQIDTEICKFSKRRDVPRLFVYCMSNYYVSARKNANVTYPNHDAQSTFRLEKYGNNKLLHFLNDNPQSLEHFTSKLNNNRLQLLKVSSYAKCIQTKFRQTSSEVKIKRYKAIGIARRWHLMITNLQLICIIICLFANFANTFANLSIYNVIESKELMNESTKTILRAKVPDITKHENGNQTLDDHKKGDSIRLSQFVEPSTTKVLSKRQQFYTTIGFPSYSREELKNVFTREAYSSIYVIKITKASWDLYSEFKEATCRNDKEIPIDNIILHNTDSGYFSWEENVFHEELRKIILPKTHSNQLTSLIDAPYLKEMDPRLFMSTPKSMCKSRKLEKVDPLMAEREEFEDYVINRVFSTHGTIPL